jgi:flagellar basal-body rod protein FlgB
VQNNTGLLGLIANKMSYLTERQVVLSQNVANADTPGYKPRDLVPFSFKDELEKIQKGSSVTARITQPQHIVPASQSGGKVVSKAGRDYDTLPDGNSVVIENQMMKVSETASEYQTMTGLYRKITSLFRMAIGRVGG